MKYNRFINENVEFVIILVQGIRILPVKTTHTHSHTHTHTHTRSSC